MPWPGTAPTAHHGSAAHSTSEQLAPNPLQFWTGKHGAWACTRGRSGEVADNHGEAHVKAVGNLNQAESALVEIIAVFELVKFKQEGMKFT